MIFVLSGSSFSYSSKLEEKLFFNLGHFSAVFLYQSYLNIGMIADAWTQNVYKPEDAKSFLQTNIGFITNSMKNWKELTDFSISVEDRDTLLAMITAAEDLKCEADAMLKYIESRNQADMDSYERCRTAAWAKIEKYMDSE